MGMENAFVVANCPNEFIPELLEITFPFIPPLLALLSETVRKETFVAWIFSVLKREK
jgi:hypothetical protein